jgi:DNA helicase-2/ATP-dependent DNA helicase PcrA
VYNKNIQAQSQDAGPSVVVSTHTFAHDVHDEIAAFCYKLKTAGKIEDYSQIAFLFPAMRNNAKVKGFLEAFERLNNSQHLVGTEREIKIYAPRAWRFLEVEEARAVWGLFLLVFGMPQLDQIVSADLDEFTQWMNGCAVFAKNLCAADAELAAFVREKQKEIAVIEADYEILTKAAEVAACYRNPLRKIPRGGNHRRFCGHRR